MPFRVQHLQRQVHVTDLSGQSVPVDFFAHAGCFRANRFRLPQIDLVGKQMTQAPSPVRVLHFGRYEVPDYALQKVIRELDESDQRLIRAYLWSNGEVIYDAVDRKYVELDPPFPRDTERAFKRVFKILEQLGVLTLSTPLKRGDDNGGPAL